MSGPSATRPSARATDEPLDDGSPMAGHGSPTPRLDPDDRSSRADRTPGGGRASLGATPVACDAQRVLQTSCQGCHGADPGSLAPMALVGREDLLAPAVSEPDKRVIDLLTKRIHNAEAPMPPPSSRPLTPEELAALDRLSADGVPAANAACESATDQAAANAPDESEIDQCYRFVAHDREEPGDETPFSAPSGEYYGCFFFDIPWQGGAQAITFRSLDTQLTHHWALSDTTQAFTPGQVVRDAPNCGLGAERLLAVYGLNQQRELNMPEDVGLKLPGPSSGRGILLGVHFFNSGEATTDQAGVEVCTARKPRPNEATVSLLGSEVFFLGAGQETTIESECSPSTDQPIHIFRSFPHMHSRGVAFDAVIERAGGDEEPLLDIPYDFNNQLMYDTPAVLQVGDRIHTRCHFRNASDRIIASGELESNEMCANFVYAWPAHALANGRALSGAMDTCMR